MIGVHSHHLFPPWGHTDLWSEWVKPGTLLIVGWHFTENILLTILENLLHYWHHHLFITAKQVVVKPHPAHRSSTNNLRIIIDSLSHSTRNKTLKKGKILPLSQSFIFLFVCRKSGSCCRSNV